MTVSLEPGTSVRFRAYPRSWPLAYAPPRPSMTMGETPIARATLPAPSRRPGSAAGQGGNDRPCRPDRTRAPRAPRPRASSPSSCRSSCRRSPSTRVEGPAAPVGPLLPPDVLVPRELPGGPHPRLHRPLLATRRRRPRSVLGAGHDPAPGLRRGPDRRRQRPQPVRPPADRVQGRARRPGPRPTTRLTRSALAWNADSAGWLALRRGSWPIPATRSSRAGSRDRRPARDGPGRGRRRLPSARPSAQLLFVRTTLDLDDRTDRSWPPPSPGSSTARARATSRSSCRTRSAWRRATSATSRPDRLRLTPSATSSTASPQARPPLPGAAAPGRGRRPARRRARRRARAREALREPGRPDRARLVVTSPPYLRVVKYGYYNWLRTWFLGFDAASDRRDPRRRPPPRAVPAFLRDVLAGLRPVLPTTPSSCSSSVTSRPTAGGRSTAASASPSGSGSGGRARGLPPRGCRSRRRRAVAR